MSTEVASLPPVGLLYNGFYFGAMMSTALYGITCMQTWVLLILECITRCMLTLQQILLLRPVRSMAYVLVRWFTWPRPQLSK